MLSRICDNRNKEKLTILDSLYRISDGYTSEFFADSVGISIFENCLDLLLEYVSLNPQSSLINLIPNSLNYNIEFSKRYNKTNIINKLNNYYKSERNPEFKKIVHSIINKLN